MDLPDCPPGAEGYQDSVTEVPKKFGHEEPVCTKAEQEFQEHLNSLKIRLEDGETRCMVERRGRDISGKWIYLCYPCAAVCSGESILQTHISGKKHKIKLTMRTIWPKSIFDDHPFNQTGNKTVATERVLKRMAEEVDLHNRNPSELDKKYNKYRAVNCHIQDSLDDVKAPLIGVEYLIEHPPEQVHYEPSYMCTLCSKQGHPRTIINHMTCFWHRHNYLLRHFPLACGMLAPYRSQQKYREGVGVIMNRLAQRIEDKYGRKRPVNIDKEEYEKDKVQIHEWVFRGHHFSEKDGATFTEVVDIGLIDSLHKSNEESKARLMGKNKREPSPPIVAAPSRPLFNNFSDLDVVDQVDLTTSPQVPEGSAGSGVRQKRVRSRKRPRSRKPKHLRFNPLAAQVIAAPLAPATLPLPEPPTTVTTQKNTSLPPVVSELVLNIDQVDLTAISSDSEESGEEGTRNRRSLLRSLRCYSFDPPTPATLPGPPATVTAEKNTSLPPVFSESVVNVDQVNFIADPSVSWESEDGGARNKQSLLRSLRRNSFDPPTPTTLAGPSAPVITQKNTSLLPVISELVVDDDQVDMEAPPSFSGKRGRGGSRQKRRRIRSNHLRTDSFYPSTPAPLPGPSTTVPQEAPLPPVYSNSAAYRPAGRQERRAGSVESLSDISDEAEHDLRREPGKRLSRDRHDSFNKSRYEPYMDKRRGASPFRNRHARAQPNLLQEKQTKAPNYEYKVKLAEEKRLSAEDSLKKTLAYHEKNPEKHPLYPEEWKKFWNRRYKEIQGEGKDPSKHDFKPEWIVFWTARMKELHEEELRIQVNEIYRRLCLSPSDMSKRASESSLSVEKSRAPEPRRKSPEVRRKSPEFRRKSPEPRRKSLEPRRRSPELRRRSPERRRPERPERSDRLDRPDRLDRYDRPEHRGREPLPRRRTPPDFRRDRRSPPPHVRRSPGRRRSLDRRRSPPPRHHRSRSRSPLHGRSPARTHISLDSIRRSSRSPLSQREQQRNRSPDHTTRQVAPSMQTVLISDDELKHDDGLSPWNSDNDIESVVSGPETRTDRSRAGSMVSRSSKARRRPSVSTSQPDSAADDVVATLRQLVALEDYLGSLGPKIVDLLADALKMEKEKANSSEELLERESAVVLIETAKEKLKGAVQAGLVGPGAAGAVRAAVVRAAAALHEADKRARLKQKQTVGPSKTTAVPVAVAGVGEVDRAQIAQQMAEALIAQGKTDVSSEDLAVLVDAVVGMAEAKKRAAQQTKKIVVQPTVEKPVVKPPPTKQSSTASALQMLQSAYDENDKKIEQINAPDAMDGLSDSDLETLLKNFNELSAEEQHSLIAYLKKLEAKEPERVERLRQYVSDAASTAPKELTPEDTEPEEPVKSVTIESDDDDYTVEEVFQSATQKVKEDQIRQEMEIVKKSLEETKVEPAVIEPTKLEKSLADITKSLSTSSATDLFALVQASMKSTPAATPAPLAQSPNVVASNTQPRSFGDLPEQAVTQELLKPLMQSAPVTPMPLLTSFMNQTQGPGPTQFQNQQSLLRLPVHFQPPQQQQQQHQLQQQHQQRPQQQLQQQEHQQQQQHHQQQQNYQSSTQNQQNYQSPQQNYPSPPQNQQQQQNYQPPQKNYQPPQQNQQQPLYNQGQQQQNYQPPPQHQQHNQTPQHNQLLPPHQQRNQPPHQQQYQPPQHQQQYQPPPQHQQQQHFNDNRNKPNDHFTQGQWNARPNMMDNRGPPIRGPAPDNFGPNASYNQGPRNNFMNGRGQDNYDTRPQVNQQFGNNNYDNNQNSFRGRGGIRGNFGGANRGRGRGYF